jgi:hypothetical protein
MKKVLAIVAGLALAASSYGMTLAEGTKEISLKGFWDAESINGSLFFLEAGYGVFVMDNVEVGARVAVEDNDAISTWAVGAFGEYNFDIGSELVPYVGAEINYANSDVDGVNENGDAIEGVGSVGLKYFVTETLAIDGAFNYKWASENIYPDDDDMNDSTYNLTVGLRYLIGAAK